MDKAKISYEHKFNDLSECTEYYYDEFGKVDAVFASGALSKKERKRLHNLIMKLLESNLADFERKRKANDKVDKADIRDFNREFKKQHSTNAFVKGLKATLSFPKKAINFLTKGKKCAQIDVIPEEQLTMNEQQEKLSHQPSTSEEVVSIEDTAQAEG